MPRARLAGLDLNWIDDGQGPPVLALHCALSHGGVWRSFLRPAADRFRLLAPDLPGHGRTGFDPSRDIQAQGVAGSLAVIEGLGSPCHLLGHSFGATVALRLAHEHPGLVKSLTLIEPVWFAFLHDAGDPRYLEYLRRARPVRAAFEAGDPRRATEAFLELWGGGGVQPGVGPQWDYMVERIHTIEASEASIVTAEGTDRLRLQDLSLLPFPVQLVRGAQTDPVIAGIHEVLGRQLGLHAEDELVVEGAGHMVPITHPKPVLERFLRLTED